MNTLEEWKQFRNMKLSTGERVMLAALIIINLTTLAVFLYLISHS
jgi:hypothetical protein